MSFERSDHAVFQKRTSKTQSECFQFISSAQVLQLALNVVDADKATGACPTTHGDM